MPTETGTGATGAAPKVIHESGYSDFESGFESGFVSLAPEIALILNKGNEPL